MTMLILDIYNTLLTRTRIRPSVQAPSQPLPNLNPNALGHIPDPIPRYVYAPLLPRICRGIAAPCRSGPRQPHAIPRRHDETQPSQRRQLGVHRIRCRTDADRSCRRVRVDCMVYSEEAFKRERARRQDRRRACYPACVATVGRCGCGRCGEGGFEDRSGNPRFMSLAPFSRGRWVLVRRLGVLRLGPR